MCPIPAVLPTPEPKGSALRETLCVDHAAFLHDFLSFVDNSPAQALHSSTTYCIKYGTGTIMKCPGWRPLPNCLVRRFARPVRALHRPGSFVPAREGVFRLRPQGRVGRRQHPDLSGDAAGTYAHAWKREGKLGLVCWVSPSVAGVLIPLHRRR